MTASTRLPAILKRLLSLSINIRVGLDKIAGSICDPNPKLDVDELRKHCASFHLFTATVDNVKDAAGKSRAKHDYLSKFTIVAPKPSFWPLFLSMIGTRYDTKINHIEPVLEFVTRSVEDAKTVQQILLQIVLPNQYRFKQEVKIERLTTAYFNSAENYGRSAYRYVIYPTRDSKQAPGNPAGHTEYRIVSLAAIGRMGIRTVHDVPLFDVCAYWRENAQIFDFSKVDLGALLAPELSKEGKIKRAHKFMRDTSTHPEGWPILQNMIQHKEHGESVKKLLKPLDVRDLLPKGPQPLPDLPVIPQPKVFLCTAKRENDAPAVPSKKKLTYEQQAFIYLPTTATSAEILRAAAGTGKTCTMHALMEYLVESGYYEPRDFLVLAHSKKVVADNKERLSENLEGAQIRSFSSVAFYMLPDDLQEGVKTRPDSYSEAIIEATRLLRAGAIFPPGEFKWLFIDEYQDMDEYKLQFVLELQKHIPHIRLLGDAHQSIMNFGKNHVRAINIQQRLGATVKRLTISQRVPTPVCDFIRSTLGIEIYGVREGQKPMLITECDHIDAIDLIVPQVKTILEVGDPPSSIVIQTRLNGQQRFIANALTEEGINCVATSVKGSMWPRMFPLLDLLDFVIETATRYGKPGGEPPDQETYRTVAKRLDRYVLDRAMPISADHKKTCCQTFWGCVRTPSFTGKYNATARLFMSLQRGMSKADKQLLAIEIRRWAAVAAGFSEPKQFKAYIEELCEQPPILVTTIHAFKGGEADHNFVVGCVDGVMPKKGEPWDDERKLFYVAVSRTRKRLYIFESTWYQPGAREKDRTGTKFKYTGKTYDQPSPFIPAKALAAFNVRTAAELQELVRQKKSAPKGRLSSTDPGKSSIRVSQ